MDNPKPGKTIWEMLMERLQGAGGNGNGIPFYNPLRHGIGSAVPVSYANGPRFTGYDFSVREILEYTRHLAGADYRFTDYALRGVNTKSMDAESNLAARLRAIPNAAGAFDSLLLGLWDEFAFAEDFLAVVKDDTNLFKITDDKTGAEDTFIRVNGVNASYNAAVLSITGTTPDGKAAPGRAQPLKVEYWDYWRDAELPGGGKTAKEFVFVEMNSDTGWFQIWRGAEYFS
jgi:hypothetical protein